jgi:sporulation-control protein spo0M
LELAQRPLSWRWASATYNRANGTVTIRGGKATQEIDAIYFAYLTQYRGPSKNHVVDVGKQVLLEKFSIAPEELKIVELILQVPQTIPITEGNTRVWIQTGLDIDWALDPKDKDFIQIKPTKEMELPKGSMLHSSKSSITSLAAANTKT